jgi:hypothetical protein
MRYIGLVVASFGLTAVLATTSFGADPRSGGLRSTLFSPLLRGQERRLAESGQLGNPGRVGLIVADRLLNGGDRPFKKGSVNLVTTVGNHGRVVFVAAAPTDSSAPATNLGVVEVSAGGKVRVHVFDGRDARFLRKAVRGAVDSARESGQIDARATVVRGSHAISESDVPKIWGGALVSWHTAFYPSISRSSWSPASE